MTVVLDSSAVLALLYRETGHERVSPLLGQALVSAVNWSEIVQKLAHRGDPSPEDTVGALQAIGLTVLPFTDEDAVRAARLWLLTRGQDRRLALSLAERACLAVALGQDDPVVVTADQEWANYDLGVSVTLIR